RYMGAGSMQLAAMTPAPGQVLEPQQPLVVSAKIPNHKSIDPKSVGVALISAGMVVPYSYDSREGSIQLVIQDALASLKGTYQRALIWATDVKTGKRVEASWTFRLGAPDVPPAGVASPAPSPVGEPAATGGGGGGSSLGMARVVSATGAGSPQRAPR
ncbi:MAG TPA: hypothetical protein VFL80_13675, partial [Thermoanaerobaculia bacterium]|nr:hypothetical protein [Thermoanaerobaculia bacterium]